MCKTIQDSVLSGTLSYITGAVLIATGKPKYIWLGGTIIVIGTMQWVDMIIWYLKQNDMPTMEFSKYAVVAVLILEPLAAYLGYVFYSGNRILAYEVVYILASIFIVRSWFEQCKETTVTADGYLKWCDITFKSTINKTIFIALLFFPFIYFPDVFLRNAVMLTAFVLWLYNLNHEAFGSRWCNSVNILDMIILGNLYFAK